VAYYYEGARPCQARHFALRQRVARTYGVSLRRQPGSRDYHQESHVLFSTSNERAASFDGLAGTTRHPLSTSVYPQRAQSSRLLFKVDRPRHVVAVALRSVHVHAASASDVPEEYISLDAFACPKSKVTSRFVSGHFVPETLEEDGLLLD
jgi:hypothetical protein